MQGVVELAVFKANESLWRTTSPLEASSRAGVGSKVRLGREARHVADRIDDPGGRDGSYAEDLGEGGA